MNTQEEFDRQFRMMIKADPGLQAMDRDGGRLDRNHRWADGGPAGRALAVAALTAAAWCLVPLIVLSAAAVLTVKGAAGLLARNARHRERGNDDGRA